MADKNLAVYSGCDRRGGHLYKFVSSQKVFDPQDKSNSCLFESGILYGAKLNPDGTGEWIALTPNTAIDPVSPSQVVGGMVVLPNSDRAEGGVMEVTSEEQLKPLISQYKTLGDLYPGNSYRETQGAILTKTTVIYFCRFSTLEKTTEFGKIWQQKLESFQY